jgi:hypothetical protein
MPLSWRHYVHGMRHLSRAAAREILRTHHAVAAANAVEQDRKRFVHDQQRVADY